MANVPLGQAARATRTVSAGIGPISWGYIDIGFLLCMLTCLVLPWHCTIPVFLSFVNRVSQGWVFCETSRKADSPRRGGGGREEGWGPLGRPASCSPAASPPLSPTLFKSEGKKPIRWSCDERASSSTGNTNEWNAPYLRDRAAPGARSPCRVDHGDHSVPAVHCEYRRRLAASATRMPGRALVACG